MSEENAGNEEVKEETTAPEAATESKRPRKLSKSIKGNIVSLTELVTGVVVDFDVAALSEEIQQKLAVYGASQKLGDAAAGKSGQEAIDAINKVAEGLVAGDWSVRAPAAQKITKKGLSDQLSNLPEAEAEEKRELLRSLGIDV